MITLHFKKSFRGDGLRFCAFRTRQFVIALIWVVAGICGAAATLCPQQAIAETQIAAKDNGRASAIIVGFLGGFVHSNDQRHVEVQMAQQLRAIYGNSAHVEIFENRQRAKAYKSIVNWLDSNGDGVLSDDEKHSIPIILFGHSWGASVMIYLARDLEAAGIPVLLTIQVDSVRKNRESDSLIPANVGEAVNFYQSKGILHGCSRIQAEDSSRTKILGNFHFQYDKSPAECQVFPWYDRFFSKGHIAIECDPRVWSQVENLIRTHVQSGPGNSEEFRLGYGSAQGQSRNNVDLR